MPAYNVYANGTYWGQWDAASAEDAVRIAADEVGTVDVGANRASTQGMIAVEPPLDFAPCYVADWRDGEMPKTDGATHVVSHDTRHHAYCVPARQVEKFYRWVADTFCGDNDPLFDEELFDGSVLGYLDEIDVSVREV